MGLLFVKLAFGALLGLSIGRAFFGAPPGRPRRGAGACGTLGALGYAAAMLAAVRGDAVVACALLAAAVEALALGVWLARGSDDPPEDGPEQGEPPPDWTEFDRARERWGRPRDRTPAA